MREDGSRTPSEQQCACPPGPHKFSCAHAGRRTIDAQALREQAERMVRNLNGSDRMTSASVTLLLLDEIERLRGENETLHKNNLTFTAKAVELEAEVERLQAALVRIADADVRYVRDGHGFSHNLYGDSPHGFGYLGSAAPILQGYAREGLGRE